ncbi:MAG TPA: S4 domain-containing protein [Arenimonas sp.]|nr:S4 domain-containing protein [Arenimonas sp.]
MKEELLNEVRADIWLWAARFYKTRSLAKQMLVGGKVDIVGQNIKPSRMLRVGDVLTINRANELYVVTVLALSEMRGPASKAQALYQEADESRIKREADREMRKLANAGYQAPATKPDKRARRLIQALGDIDSL